ncbi:hypothetical protein GYH30_015918 [Glycine max]|uniref:Helicase C-terminal domain-containing protein n=1 Tax=Glycine max TaxID=3847 RepID=K7KWL9_SOYBN|nr:hypothetical protein GYH30_015918 [Glycine max]
MDRFHENENGILVATDVAARGLDILGVRIVVHYQLPHSAEGYVHRSGRTTRAFAEGCSIALISSRDTSKFVSLCKSFSKDKKNWFDRNASSLELVTENYDSEEAQVNKHKQMKTISRQLKKLQKELEMLILHPLQSKTFLHRYLAGALSLLLMVLKEIQTLLQKGYTKMVLKEIQTRF